MKYSKDIIYILIAIIALGLLFYVSKKENMKGDYKKENMKGDYKMKNMMGERESQTQGQKDSRVFKKKGKGPMGMVKKMDLIRIAR